LSLLPVRRRAATAAPPAENVAPGGELTVVAARHPWRWVSTAIVLVLVAQLVHGLATGDLEFASTFGDSGLNSGVDAL
jgi:polar amino acid transport system permease protein